MHVADEFDSAWVTCFQDQAELLLGASAKELGQAKQHDEDEFSEMLSKINHGKYFMKLRVKGERYNVSDVVTQK